METLKKRRKEEVEKYSAINIDVMIDHHKTLEIKKQLGAQLNEVESVLEELKLLHDDNTTYKAIGPVLVKQDLKEAKDTVSKRRNYIRDQIKRNDDLLKDLDTKRQIAEDVIKKIETQLQQLQIKTTNNPAPAAKA